MLAGLAGIAFLLASPAAFAAGPPASFDVESETAEPKREQWVCDFSESGRLAGHQIVIDYRPESAPKDNAPVKVTLTPDNNRLTVDERRGEQTADYCGFNDFIGGDYRRRAKR